MTDDPQEFDGSLRRTLDRMAPPAGDVRGSFADVVTGARRLRRRRVIMQSSLALGAAAAVAVAVVVATRQPSHPTHVSTGPVAPTTLIVPTVPTTVPVPTTAAVATTSTTAATSARCPALRPSSGPRAALDSCSVFVVTPRSATGTGYSTVAEFDRQTGRMVHQLQLPGVDTVGVARAGAWLWVAAGSSVERIDPVSLTVQATIPVPYMAGAIAATPAGAWVGGPGRLDFVVATGALVVHAAVGGNVSSLAVSTAGDRLYVAEANVTNPQTGLLVTERDAASGAELASRSEPLSLGGGAVVATDAGVWVDFPSGMANTGVFLRSSDLQQVGNVPELPEGSGRFELVVTPQVLWIHAVHTYCADPVSGALRIPTGRFDAAPLAADGTEVFVAQGSGIALAPTDPRCIR